MKKTYLFIVAFVALLAFNMPLYAQTSQNLPTIAIGKKGKTELKVLDAYVLDGTLTVSLALKNNNTGYDHDEVDFFGDEPFIQAGGKKYNLLPDVNPGEYWAWPQGMTYRVDGPGKKTARYGANVHDGRSALVWMKFYAPPEGKDVVELLLPGIPPLTFRITRY